MTLSAPPPGPRAVILAAGRGSRLGPGAADRPKILLEFGGRTLLARHLDLLERAGSGPVSLVVGYRRDAIEAELERLGRRHAVSLIDNPDWRLGSLVSLDCAGCILRGGTPVLLMDGDVLYDFRLLERLLRSEHESVLLLDRTLEPGDEPVKICVAGARRIVDFSKVPEVPSDWHGESVGFFRFSPGLAAELADCARGMIKAGGRAREYEDAIRALIRKDRPGDRFGFEEISGLPWTEIDFMEDVERARALLAELAA